jgi:very-short-patch-repair endonuclease
VDDEPPPLTGSPLLDPWRLRHRQQLGGLVPAQPQVPHEWIRSEAALWEVLRREPQEWVREYATGRYRLDFSCPAAKLAVEVDGRSHDGRAAWDRDVARDDHHRTLGIITKRFSADEVERDLDMVLAEVRRLTRSADRALIDEPQPADLRQAPPRRARRSRLAPAAVHRSSSTTGPSRRVALKGLSLLLRFGPPAVVIAVGFNVAGIQQPVGHLGRQVIVDPIVNQFQDGLEKTMHCTQARVALADAQAQVQTARATTTTKTGTAGVAAAQKRAARTVLAAPTCFTATQLAQARQSLDDQ